MTQFVMTQRDILIRYFLHTPPKLIISLKNPQTTEIQRFEPHTMVRAYIYMKISEYSPTPIPKGLDSN